DLSADGTFSWWHSGRHTTNKTLRKRHAIHNNTAWPLDPDTGKNQDVSHEVPLADGGPDHISNVTPRSRKDHIRRHRENDDYKRWQKLRGK
ncbi:unnamed protein product, partial [Ectocarpus sp. 12 AP-2014]